MQHGTHGAYKNGCRCDTCRSFRADYMRNKRNTEGNIDGTARNRAIAEAARRYREAHPLEWAQLVADHRSQIKYETNT